MAERVEVKIKRTVLARLSSIKPSGIVTVTTPEGASLQVAAELAAHGGIVFVIEGGADAYLLPYSELFKATEGKKRG